MSSFSNPIALLEQTKEKAMGFLFKKPSLLSPPIVSVEIGHAHLIVLSVEKKRDQVEVSHFHLEPRPSTPEAVSDRLRAIFQDEGIGTDRVRTILKSEGMVIRILNFPQMKRSELASMLQYEVEKYIPFRFNEIVLDFQILTPHLLRGGVKTMDTLLVTVKRSEVDALLEIFKKADIRLETMGVGNFAFANLLEFLYPPIKEGAVAYLDMGMESTTLGVLLQGKPAFMRDISIGGRDFLKVFKRRLELEAEAILQMQKEPERMQTPEYVTSAELALQPLLNEVKLSLGYYQDHVPQAEPIQTLYVAGGGLRLLPSTGLLEKEIKIPILRPDPFSQIKIQSHLDEAALKQNSDLLLTTLGSCLP